MSQRHPNVILITGDHWRGDVLHCAGADFLQTPNVDRMAAEGVRFANACASNPICVPARATFTTGNHSHICTGSKGNGGRIKDDQVKIAQHFVENGYRSYALGKLHYVPYENPRVVHGFQVAELCEEGRAVWQRLERNPDLWNEEYDDYLKSVRWGGYQRAHGIGNNDIHAGSSPLREEHYVDSWVTTRSLHWIEEHRRQHPDQPFFMWTSFIKPHPPYDPPRPFDRMYDPRDIPAPVGGPEDLQHASPALSLRPASYGWDRMGPEGFQNSRAHFYGLVSFLDKQIGRLLGYLEDNGLREDTILLLSADHGDLLGDHGIFFKSCFFNGSVRIPFIVSAPGQGVPKGEVRDHPVGTEDALPTLCDLAGVPVPDNIHGKSLRQAMSDASAHVRDYYVSETGGAPNQSMMVFDGRWKYVYSELNGVEALYNEEADPHETCNVIGENPDRAAAMREYLVNWCKEYGDDEMLDPSGNQVRTEFKPEEHMRTPKQCLGWRPY